MEKVFFCHFLGLQEPLGVPSVSWATQPLPFMDMVNMDMVDMVDMDMVDIVYMDMVDMAMVYRHGGHRYKIRPPHVSHPRLPFPSRGSNLVDIVKPESKVWSRI